MCLFRISIPHSGDSASRTNLWEKILYELSRYGLRYTEGYWRNCYLHCPGEERVRKLGVRKKSGGEERMALNVWGRSKKQVDTDTYRHRHIQTQTRARDSIMSLERIWSLARVRSIIQNILDVCAYRKKCLWVSIWKLALQCNCMFYYCFAMEYFTHETY